MPPVRPRLERVLLASVHADPPAAAEARLDELGELARSAGCVVVGRVTQRRAHPAPGTWMGPGKLEELARECARVKAEVVIANEGLSPTQLKALEDAVSARVLDRTGLILDIFALRARSREGQLQVELAQHLYRLPRLRGKGTELSRLGGGVGTRGPGEQKLEYDRRRIRDRIARLKREIEKLRERRGRQREHRHDRALPAVALAGYTNAGKSTLFNALARAGAVAKQQMFSTLDPTVRLVRLPEGGRVLLSDTVGFIRDLPEDLRIAFRATLEELAQADCILHVVDLSHPDAAAQLDAVREELAAVDAAGVPSLLVLNKVDRVASAPLRRAELLPAGEEAVAISALAGTGLPGLLAEIERILRHGFWTRVALVDPAGDVRARLARLGASCRETPAERGGTLVEAWVTPAQAAGLAAAAREGAPS